MDSPMTDLDKLTRAAEHWHTLYRTRAQEAMDEAARHGTEIVGLEQQLADLTQERDALKEWRRIILGTGTDQEAVIRLAASEYTKVAVECWKKELANAKATVLQLQSEMGELQAKLADLQQERASQL